MAAVAGIFHDRAAAERGLTELYRKGFDNEQIGVIWRDRSYSEPVEAYDYRERHYVEKRGGIAQEVGKGAAGGAVGGATVGAGTMLLASAGLALIPGIGALLAAGTAAATLAGATAGAVAGGVTGGIIGALIGGGDDDGEVTDVHSRYRDAIAGEGYVVTITTDSSDRATEALSNAGAESVTVVEGADHH